jgi:CheY-like chemotaxis protein
MDDPATILVVEDDPDVRTVATEFLRSCGHRVLEAATGLEALVLFDDHPEIDLIFTDIIMPGLDGFKLADMAKVRRPEVKVLYVTAYVQRANDLLGTQHGEILMKPYRSSDLDAAVARALRA